MGEESKIYYATTRRGDLLWLIIYFLFMLSTSRGNPWFISITVVFIVAFIIAMFIKYSFTIRDDKITFKVFLFNKVINKKQVDHSMITKIVFRRINWSTKQAVIKLKKGRSIRVSLFTPDTVFNDIIAYCEEYEIPFTKTKDYKILER